jgi:hypothetical protein
LRGYRRGGPERGEEPEKSEERTGGTRTGVEKEDKRLQKRIDEARKRKKMTGEE